MPKQRYWNGLEWEVLGTDASKVDILDSEGLYEATDAEGALAEVADDLLRHRNESATNAHLPKNVGLSNVDNAKQMPIAGGTFTGIAKAQANTSYTVAQVRNVILSTGDAHIGSMGNGDLWIKYE